MAHSSASIVVSDDLDAGFSGAGDCYTGTRRRRSYRALPACTGPAPVFFCGAMSVDQPGHFLDSCFLCKKPLSCNRDIYMYRGDTPFCSEECRQEQIDIDEAKHMQKKLPSPSWKKGFSSSTNPLNLCDGAADAVVAR